MSNELPEYFTEMATSVSMGNGVVRVTFAQQEANDTTRPVVRLLIPVNKMAGLISSLGSAITDLESRAKAASATRPAPSQSVPAKVGARAKSAKDDGAS